MGAKSSTLQSVIGTLIAPVYKTQALFAQSPNFHIHCVQYLLRQV